jgi:hypothetical protein
MKLLVEKLRSGALVVRPEGALGTCGWYPRAWTLAVVDGDVRSSFLDNNPNWVDSDITGIVWEL